MVDAVRELSQGDAVNARVITHEEAVAIAENRMCYGGDTQDCARTLASMYVKLAATDSALGTARLERDRAYMAQDNAVARMAEMDKMVRELLAIETDEDESPAAVARRSKAKVRLLVKLAQMIEVAK